VEPVVERADGAGWALSWRVTWRMVLENKAVLFLVSVGRWRSGSTIEKRRLAMLSVIETGELWVCSGIWLLRNRSIKSETQEVSGKPFLDVVNIGGISQNGRTRRRDWGKCFWM
jgi:hypothetical protein